MFHQKFRAAALLTAAALAGIGLAGTAHAQADTLQVGVATLPPSRGMPHSHAGAITGYTYFGIFDFLARPNNDGEMQPQLATSWKNTSNTTWEFKIRPGVVFSNGDPLNAAAVADALKWYLTDEGKATVVGRAFARIMSNARAIDDSTVEISSTEPNPSMPAQLYAGHIFAAKALKDRGMDGFASQPVGTGPFQVTRWDPERVTMETAPNSWRPAKLKRIVVNALPEPTARVQALVSGQIDYAPSVTFDSVKQIEAAGLKTDIYPAPYVLSWAFFPTHRDTPFKDVRVRRAANIAIDRQAIIDGLLLGKSIPATQPAAPSTFGYNPNVKPFPYDPAQARRLLAEAGYPNGFEYEAVVLPGNFPADRDIYQQVAQDLSKVGIKVNLQAITFADFVKVITAPGDPKDYGKAWGERVYSQQQDFSVDLVPDASTRLINPWGCRRPVPFWCDKTEDELLAKSQAEFDVEKRRKILQEHMQVFHDNAPALFLVNVVDVVGRSAKVQGAQLIYRVPNYHEMTKN